MQGNASKEAMKLERQNWRLGEVLNVAWAWKNRGTGFCCSDESNGMRRIGGSLDGGVKASWRLSAAGLEVL